MDSIFDNFLQISKHINGIKENNMKCCKSYCDCNCHKCSCNHAKESHCECPCHCNCRCCQPEFKKGDWVTVFGSKDNSLRYFLKDDSIIKVRTGEIWSGTELVRSSYQPHTLTADDLIPCLYCEREMEVRKLGRNRHYSRCSNLGDDCCLVLPTRKTEALAVADVLLLKMRKEACDF